jgi:hypothetical protein
MSINHELFAAVLGGLGQCGIITRAEINLVPAKPLVRVYLLHHTDNATFFRDLRTLLNRGELNGIINRWIPNPDGTPGLTYELVANIFFDPSQPPDDQSLLRELSLPPSAAVQVDLSYPIRVTQVNSLVDFLKRALNWDGLVKPWLHVWLSDSAPSRTTSPNCSPHSARTALARADSSFSLRSDAPRSRAHSFAHQRRAATTLSTLSTSSRRSRVQSRPDRPDAEAQPPTLREGPQSGRHALPDRLDQFQPGRLDRPVRRQLSGIPPSNDAFRPGQRPHTRSGRLLNFSQRPKPELGHWSPHGPDRERGCPWGSPKAAARDQNALTK